MTEANTAATLHWSDEEINSVGNLMKIINELLRRLENPELTDVERNTTLYALRITLESFSAIVNKPIADLDKHLLDNLPFMMNIVTDVFGKLESVKRKPKVTQPG